MAFLVPRVPFPSDLRLVRKGLQGHPRRLRVLRARQVEAAPPLGAPTTRIGLVFFFSHSFSKWLQESRSLPVTELSLYLCLGCRDQGGASWSPAGGVGTSQVVIPDHGHTW